MNKFKKFMAVHNNPGVDCHVVQANLRKRAKIESAKWIRTYFNEKEGIRYCLWLARSPEELKNIFTEMDVPWESIIQVEEASSDMHITEITPSAIF